MALPPFPPIPERGWRPAVGLRRLDGSAWLHVDADRPGQLAAKAALPLSATWAATGTDCSPAAAEVRALVVEALGDLVRADADGAVIDVATGIGAPAGAHPLLAAASVLQEDLCLLGPDGRGGWRLEAASVCFPSRWSLAAKVGAGVDAIHAPVPGYAESLSRPVALALDRLPVGRVVWRSNWTLVDDPALHQPAPPAPRPVVAPGGVWLRVERQTLRRLEAGAVLFTIRTYVAPLGEVPPAWLASLRAALGDVPAAVDAYKGWQALRPAVLAWLDA